MACAWQASAGVLTAGATVAGGVGAGTPPVSWLALLPHAAVTRATAPKAITNLAAECGHGEATHFDFIFPTLRARPAL